MKLLFVRSYLLLSIALISMVAMDAYARNTDPAIKERHGMQACERQYCQFTSGGVCYTKDQSALDALHACTQAVVNTYGQEVDAGLKQAELNAQSDSAGANKCNVYPSTCGYGGDSCCSGYTCTYGFPWGLAYNICVPGR